MSRTNLIPEILETYKSFVWPEIKNYLNDQAFPDLFKIPKKFQNDVEEAYWKPLNEYPHRKGKYVRAAIILLVTEALGKNKLDALKTASAMQISEDWILIHDDWEDNSETRRGKPALHKIFGDKLAVNAGDGLHNIMWKILWDNHQRLGWEKSCKIANEFHTMLSRTVIGQAVELDWIRKNKNNISDEDWFFIADGKTGYYTMAGPARLGGIIGDADRSQMKILTNFGLNLGRCFQLVDDILDVTSDFSGLKKKANDILEGNKTLILGHLGRNINAKDYKKLNFVLSKPLDEKDDRDIEWMIAKMEDYKSIDYAKKIAKKYRDISLEIFKKDLKFLKVKEARNKIEVLINFMLERKR